MGPNCLGFIYLFIRSIAPQAHIHAVESLVFSYFYAVSAMHSYFLEIYSIKFLQAIEAVPVFKASDLQLIYLGANLENGDAFAAVPDCAAWGLH